MSQLYYSPRDLQRILKLKPRDLRQWQDLGLFPRATRFSWIELQRAQALARCSRNLAPRARRRSLAAAVRRLPELANATLDASFAVFSGKLAILRAGRHMDALTGQLLLAFDAAEATTLDPPPVKTGEEAEKWFNFGLSLEGTPGLRAQAAAAYERCLELDPGFGSAYINLGTLRYHDKDYASAERCYRAAAQLDPHYALAHFNLGNVLDETGRLEEAVAAYCEAVRLAPGYADAHYNLALAYQRQGLQRKAVPHWRHYLGLDRQSPWALHARTQLKQTLERDILKIVG